MNNKFERAKEVYAYATANGIEAARKKFDMAYESVTRNMRKYKQMSSQNSSLQKAKLPKILLLDIETLPMWIRTWGLYKQRPTISQIVKDWVILSWSAKWLMSDKHECDILTSEEIKHRYNSNKIETKIDERICKRIYKLIDDADIIIAHNLNRFDIRKLNSRFMIHGMLPPSPYQAIDTLLHSQKIAAHSSHKLDWLGQLIRNEGKLQTDYELWVKCEKGEQESLDYMLAYNIEDTQLLEEVYLWMRPWMKSHPNLGLYMDLKESVCSNCMSNDIVTLSEHPYVTSAGLYDAVRCNDCGAIGRLRTTNLSIEESKKLIRSVAR